MKEDRTQRQALTAREQEDLVAYLDGELDDTAQQQLEAALGRDGALRQEADSLRRTWELLDFLPRPVPPAHFTERTLDRLEVTKLLLIRREKWWRRFALAGWVFTLTLVALLGFSVAYYWPRQDRLAAATESATVPGSAASADASKLAEPPENLREHERFAWMLQQEIGRMIRELDPKIQPYERQELNRKRRQGGLIFMEELLNLAQKYHVPLQRPAPPAAGATPSRGDEPQRPKLRPTPTRGLDKKE